MKKLIISIFLLLFSLNVISQIPKANKNDNEKLLYNRLFKAAIENDYFYNQYFCCSKLVYNVKISDIKILINDTTLVYFINQDTNYYKEYIHFFRNKYDTNMAGAIVVSDPTNFYYLLDKDKDFFSQHYKIFSIDSNKIRIYDKTGLIDENTSLELCNKKIEITHNTLNNYFDTISQEINCFLPFTYIVLSEIIKNKDNYTLLFWQPKLNEEIKFIFQLKANKLILIDKKRRFYFLNN